VLGAANIILCGHDCGSLDGLVQMGEYVGMMQPSQQAYFNWLGEIEDQSKQVREKLKEVYQCCIYSINPFLNFGLEGHSYVHS
jgi:hypothetical protein